ncbi:hypothetical protein JTE90_027228 [Oedothorax gibbosus]|uniref:THAP-type domain-containing protein n=1 Tax=Oedothorax gibbosus TaxID=931172 RepID=A0AAV6U427_9ARAC|nr:hypothetical protein JTE90_027228 [Oedothorax gibbosus]
MRKGVLPHKFDCQKRAPTGPATARRKRAKFCAVTSCINGPGSISIGVSYHEFPRDKELQADWVRFCGRSTKWRPGTSAHICSNHFSEDQLDRTTSPTHPKLMEGARPNVLLVSAGNKELYNSSTKYNKVVG